MKKIFFVLLCAGLFALNSYAQITYESINKYEVKFFLKTHLPYIDSNPMWQSGADKVNDFIIEILSKNREERNSDDLRMRAFQLLYRNTWTVFEDAVDAKRMSMRRTICFLAIALLSDDRRLRSFY